MGRQPCCDKVGLKKGPWTAEEDKKLISFILANGQCCWRAVPKLAGLLRCGKSCRLRWTNYLRPDLKRGLLTESEEKMVIDLHAQLGNRWSRIASHLPGRTDNEIKNYWNTHIKKKLKKMGIDPVTHKPLMPALNSNDEAQTQKQQPQLPRPRPQRRPPPPQEQPLPPLTCEVPQVCHMSDKETEASITKACLEESLGPIDFMEYNDGFCTDEVPLIEPHEMNLPHCPPSLTTTTISPSSSYSSSSSSNNDNVSSPNMLGDLGLANFDWDYDFTSDLGLWDDYVTNSLDLLIDGDSGMSVNCGPPPTHHDPWNIRLF